MWSTRRASSTIAWAVLALLGAAALGVIAIGRGETVNAIWIVIAATCVYLISYRFYARFIAVKVLQPDPTRPTPAFTRADGLDFVATDRRVLFGHHFAAIAGAGPLVGPVLAAQMGYLPGMLWLLAGVVLAGAVQDYVILFISMRREGKSLGELIRLEMGTIPGAIALLGAFLIVVILLAVLALIVVKALAASPWGTFTVAATIPTAFAMGIYGRWIRPGRIGEMSLLGLVCLVLALIYGRNVAESATLAPLFTLTPTTLCWLLIAYGATAALLPVWLLLAPRDYLSTFLKIGTILALAVGILIVAPPLRMPALTAFAGGGGPVWSGSMFPFLFITIACGAVSGFHSLISSGTTPKMISNETDARFIGYGAMLAESMVGIMALVAASVLDPGVYFAMNSPAAVIGADPANAAQVITHMGFAVTPDTLVAAAHDVGETSIISRAGGAPTLAVGMAHIFSQIVGGKAMMAFWYHFAILFEALFILTALDAGTRASRFMLQDLIGLAAPGFRNATRLVPSLIATFLCVAAWGYFLYQGVTDPLGGVNTLWPLFGMANQMLAAIALILATTVLFRMKRERYAWVTLLPTVWLLVCTLSAGFLKLASSDPKVGFLAHAARFQSALDRGEVLAPAHDMSGMRAILFNDRIDAGMTMLFMAVVVSMAVYGVRSCVIARRAAHPTSRELTGVKVAAT